MYLTRGNDIYNYETKTKAQHGIKSKILDIFVKVPCQTGVKLYNILPEHNINNLKTKNSFKIELKESIIENDFYDVSIKLLTS